MQGVPSVGWIAPQPDNNNSTLFCKMRTVFTVRISISPNEEEFPLKKLKTRFLSAFLVLLTLLTLLPTSALAASGSGTGIKPTTNPNLWSTRLTSTGQPYSYRPPTAAGKQLYCMDLGYSYRYGTASFLNSYTYKSATGADSDALWDAAVAGTGLGEMDAITKENVKWMMTYNCQLHGRYPRQPLHGAPNLYLGSSER